jgi:hypothetical protein
MLSLAGFEGVGLETPGKFSDMWIYGFGMKAQSFLIGRVTGFLIWLWHKLLGLEVIVPR